MSWGSIVIMESSNLGTIRHPGLQIRWSIRRALFGRIQYQNGDIVHAEYSKMQSKSVAIILSVVSSVIGHPSLHSRQAEDCDAVHIFLARGTSEEYPGRQISVVNATCNGVSSCGYEDIQYPASFVPDYCTSVGVGVTNGTSQITAYATRCPDAQLVLSGYSQVSIWSRRMNITSVTNRGL